MMDPSTTVFLSESVGPSLKSFAYGGSKSNVVLAGNLYRLRRGYPVMRAGKAVAATPQFKTLTLYSPISNNAQLPGPTITPTAMVYPKRTR